MIERSSILDYLGANKEQLMREYHLTRIGLFGSIAREIHTETSDIDLVFEYPGFNIQNKAIHLGIQYFP